MKALFVGLGSIGCRHIKNLKQLRPDIEIEAIRSSNRTLPEEIECLLSKQHFDATSLSGEFDLCFITNPTHLHLKALEQTAPFAKSYFIEKPIFEDQHEFPFTDNRPVYIAAPLRHTSLFNKLAELLKDEKCLAVRAICSSYLPEWRPGTDYTKCYSAIKEYGGGVKLDLIHEWDYIKALFGEPEQLHCISGNISELDINSEDYAIYIATCKGIPITLHLDYFGRKFSRKCEVICDKGTISAGFNSGIIKHYALGWIDCREDANTKYLAEMQHYLDVAEGKKNINDGKNALNTLKVVLA